MASLPTPSELLAPRPAPKQPGAQHYLDVAAAFRAFEACLDPAVGDDEERRHFLDPEALGEFGLLVDIHRVEDEGAVVVAALEHLGEVALHTAGRPV
jgi:hypothetical protein